MGWPAERSRTKEIEERLDLAVRNLWHPFMGEVYWSLVGQVHNVYPILELASLLIIFCFHVIQCINFFFNCFWIWDHG